MMGLLLLAYVVSGLLLAGSLLLLAAYLQHVIERDNLTYAIPALLHAYSSLEQIGVGVFITFVALLWPVVIAYVAIQLLKGNK